MLSYEDLLRVQKGIQGFVQAYGPLKPLKPQKQPSAQSKTPKPSSSIKKKSEEKESKKPPKEKKESVPKEKKSDGGVAKGPKSSKTQNQKGAVEKQALKGSEDEVKGGKGSSATKMTHFRKALKALSTVDPKDRSAVKAGWDRFDLLCKTWDEDPKEVLARGHRKLPERPT